MGAHVVVDPNARPLMEAWREVADLRPAVLFECVGVPGMLLDLMRKAPRGARIVVAGVCMEDDTIRPMLGINKELSLQFVLGYTPGEFADTLAAIADGRIDVAPLVTGRVGVEGVAQAFQRPRQPGRAREDPGRALAELTVRSESVARVDAGRGGRGGGPRDCRRGRAGRALRRLAAGQALLIVDVAVAGVEAARVVVFVPPLRVRALEVQVGAGAERGRAGRTGGFGRSAGRRGLR